MIKWNKKMIKITKMGLAVTSMSIVGGLVMIGSGTSTSQIVHATVVDQTSDDVSVDSTNQKGNVTSDSIESGTDSGSSNSNVEGKDKLENVGEQRETSNTVGIKQGDDESDTNNENIETSPIYVNSTEENNNGDGTVSAKLTYNKTEYTLSDGNIGGISSANSNDNDSTIYVRTHEQKYSGLSAGSQVLLNEPFKHETYDNNFHVNTIKHDGNTTLNVIEMMTNDSGDTYYKADDNLWLKQSNYVILNGKDTNFIKDAFSFELINNNENFKSLPLTTSTVVGSDNIASGTITVYSKYYNKNFSYSYKGKPGEIVDAHTDGDSSYILPSVRVEMISNPIKSLNPLVDNDLHMASVKLLKPGDYIYPLYNEELVKDDEVGPMGNSSWYVQKVMYAGDKKYYQISKYDWIEDSDDVELDGTVNQNDNENFSYIKYWVDGPVVGDLSLTSNLGTKIIKGISGVMGTDIVDIAVPQINGYISDKEIISAHVNVDGTITTNETVKYNRKSTNHVESLNNSSISNYNNIVNLQQTLSTYRDGGIVSLYTIDGNKVTNRALNPGTDWYSDKVMNLDNIKYYRVSTNEWVKASDVYIYIAQQSALRTGHDTYKLLVNEHDNSVGNRGLQADTNWFTDRYIFLNGQKYYRVATNEFVSTNDVRND